MANCTFCGQPIPFGTGKMYIKKDAKVLWFCSRRCEKNLRDLKRNPRDAGYTTAYAVAKRQRMAELAHHAGGEAPVKKAKASAKKTAEAGK